MIRVANSDDLATLVALDRVEPDRWSLERWSTEVGEARVTLSVSGLSAASHLDLGEERELHRLLVSQKHRREGIGRAHLESLLQRMPGVWILEVSERNEPARALYRSLGFAQVGQRLRYYRDGSTALLLRRG